jgi:peptidoglycan hydrolase-like protein with peptidoglycan-binding domain
MYRTDDKQSAIKEVQRFLLTVSQIDNEIPHVAIDGIYGDETRIAVTEFQRLMGIGITGRVDRETFDLLFIEHSRIVDETDATNRAFNQNIYPLKLGDSGNNVSIINSFILELSEYYDIPNTPNGDFYSRETENSIKLLQKHFMMETTGEVDAILEKRLRDEIIARNNFNKSL